MEALPREIVRALRVFEDVFSERVWAWVQVLVVGAILTPVPELSPGAQSGAVVEPGAESAPAAGGGRGVRAERWAGPGRLG